MRIINCYYLFTWTQHQAQVLAAGLNWLRRLWDDLDFNVITAIIKIIHHTLSIRVFVLYIVKTLIVSRLFKRSLLIPAFPLGTKQVFYLFLVDPATKYWDFLANSKIFHWTILIVVRWALSEMIDRLMWNIKLNYSSDGAPTWGGSPDSQLLRVATIRLHSITLRTSQQLNNSNSQGTSLTIKEVHR